VRGRRGVGGVRCGGDGGGGGGGLGERASGTVGEGKAARAVGVTDGARGWAAIPARETRRPIGRPFAARRRAPCLLLDRRRR